ncbi:unnamed protein product [Peronospora destructor]|uniref:Uncharacterized protein n=1 Tax=Peronospora destructor TaxID=86335 RepID=A0AAV0TH69_9STRA|nr:unnamed protein product [Peronospora destructor]
MDMCEESNALLVNDANAATVAVRTLPSHLPSVLQGYLNAEGTIIMSATVLLQLPWSYKVFLGVLSDYFPIGGFRRRPYMLIGWLLCCCMLFMMASFLETAPYYGDPSMHFTSHDEWAETQRKSINSNASDAAGKYVIPMMMVAFGYLLVEVPADAVTIEYSHQRAWLSEVVGSQSSHGVQLSTLKPS